LTAAVVTYVYIKIFLHKKEFVCQTKEIEHPMTSMSSRKIPTAAAAAFTFNILPIEKVTLHLLKVKKGTQKQ